MSRLLQSLGCAAVVLAAPGASAWPVDQAVDVPLGREHFVRFGALEWAELDDPSLADVEVMPETGELLLTGKKAGRGLLLLYAQGKAAVWRVRVGQPEQKDGPALDAAKKACPGLKLQDEEPKLQATVGTEGCRQALLALFEGDRFLARELDLTLDVKVLQAQLRDIDQALAKAKLPVSAAYSGAGLGLRGEVDAAGHRRTLWTVFRRTCGRAALDDQLQVAPPPDAGQTTSQGKETTP